MEPTISIGNYVRIKDHASIGQVVRISQQKKLLVAVGALRLYLPLKAVEVVAPPSAQKGATKQNGFAMTSSTSSSRQIDPTLDLHGLNKGQALLALEKFLDRSLLSGDDRLKIIHGQGMGILRSAIRGYLADHPLVKAVIVQSPIHCMEGMTIVEI